MSDKIYIPGFKAYDTSCAPHLAVMIAATAGTVDLATSGEKVIGICENDPTTGEAVKILGVGVTKLVVNGNSVNIAVGDVLKAYTGGIGVKAASDHDRTFAIALEPATADAVVIDVLVGTHAHVSA